MSDAGRELSRAVQSAFVYSSRIVWVVARVLAMGLLLVVATVASSPGRTRVRRWILLKGDRLVIAGGLTLFVFGSMLSLYAKGLISVDNTELVTTLFGSVISGLFSFVPIVVAVNQLTVSQLFGSPETLREQIADVRAFRQDIADFMPEEEGFPTAPDEFLADFVAIIVDRAAALSEAVDDRDDEAATAVAGYVRTIFEQAEEVEARLEPHYQSLIDVLIPMMGDGYSRNVVDARRLRREHAGALGERVDAALGQFEELFVSMDVLRQYYKALYVQQELAVLSRLIAYTGLTTFFVSSFVIIAFATGSFLADQPVARELFVSAAAAVSFAPFAILCSYMIRIATIAKRTTAPGAFTPRRETPDYRRRSRPYTDD
jgi:hypothetical protein